MINVRSKSAKWAVIAIVIAIIAVISIWLILSCQINYDKSYPGAKFIEYHFGGISSAS